MKVSEGKVVSTVYTLYTLSPDDEFELIEQTDEFDPMVYLAGHSGLPPKFEDHLNGLSEGDTFNFQIDPEDAFGEFHEDNIADFPLEMFKIEDGEVPAGFLEPGNPIPFTNEDGHKIQGQIVGVEDDTVFVDFNHPLAGKTLKFEGRVMKIREATPEELEHGHVHGPGGHHH